MTFIESPDTLRQQLWSPIQNTALWLGWWLHDVIGADQVLDAFHATQGTRHVLVATDALHHIAPKLAEDYTRPESRQGLGTDQDQLHGLVALLAQARKATEGAPMGLADRPLVSLLLAGPGDVSPIPAGTTAAEHVQAVGCAIALSSSDPAVTHVIVPDMTSTHVQWTWYAVDQPLVPLPYFSPGEADELLREAVKQSTRMVEHSGHVSHHNMGNTPNSTITRHPRLAVGSISDAFGLPGLPSGVPTRSQRLMARADTVAAIIEVTKRSAVAANLDPQLLPMLRAVRIARMVAVDYALRELVR